MVRNWPQTFLGRFLTTKSVFPREPKVERCNGPNGKEFFRFENPAIFLYIPKEYLLNFRQNAETIFDFLAKMTDFKRNTHASCL